MVLNLTKFNKTALYRHLSAVESGFIEFCLILKHFQKIENA